MTPLTVVFIISYAVHASDDCAAEAAKRPNKCYECSTLNNDPLCGDHFNGTVDTVPSMMCDGPCAKWVRKPKHGGTHYIRTCSKNLNIKMNIALVCMKESRPGDGRLCFCRKDHCNGAQSIHNYDSAKSRFPALLLLTLMTSLLLARSQVKVVLRHATWWTEVVLCLLSRIVLFRRRPLVALCRHRREDIKDLNTG